MAAHEHNTRNSKKGSTDYMEGFEKRINESISDLKDELLNLKNIIIKNLQEKNTKLKNEMIIMKKKILI